VREREKGWGSVAPLIDNADANKLIVVAGNGGGTSPNISECNRGGVRILLEKKHERSWSVKKRKEKRERREEVEQYARNRSTDWMRNWSLLENEMLMKIAVVINSLPLFSFYFYYDI
jgi:hypothetical protein